MIFGIASFLAAIVEPAWELWIDGAPYDWAFGPDRVWIFVTYLTTAVVTHVAVLSMTRGSSNVGH